MKSFLNIVKPFFKKIIIRWKLTLLILMGLYISYLVIDIIFFERDTTTVKTTAEAFLGTIALEGYSGGKKQWAFNGEEIDYQGDRVMVKKNGKGIIYKDDKPFMEVNASKVDFNMVTKDFDARGGVIIRVIGHDQEFQSEILRWNAITEKCEARGNVVARFNNNILSADNFTYFIKEEKFEINRGVKLELDITLQ
ncbi:MAG TPA: hypothetical protein PL110_11065 [Candidatus Eremiobacteraeota bacterium]|nr:MAG: hypothetical protein BWY64_00711 [bacterium ADurb.Bin363]HPZ08645.1 hypothetical protein [Candidatus Eremiobacteraeota bacterium]